MNRSLTLWSRWTDHADRQPLEEAIVHWYADASPVRFTRQALVTAALVAARSLADSGVKRGDVCALVLRHRPEFYSLYMGLSALGAVPTVLAYPNARLHPDKFVHGLSGMARKSGLDWVLTERDLESVLLPLIGGASVQGLLFPLEWPQADVSLVPPVVDGAADQPCLLQHSSGTTGLQKGVLLTHGAVLSHVAAYGEAIALRPDDKVVSWLPLYHDMGLIAAFHLPLAHGVTTVLLDPFEWVRVPGILFEAISREHGTVSWLPNFAYNLMADQVRDEAIQGFRLDHLRLLVNCSEPVRAESHRKVAERFASAGLRSSVLSASYAMAETTFAVTQTPLGTAAREFPADREAMTRGVAMLAADGAAVRRCVSSGRTIRGCAIRIVDEASNDLPDGRIGEIWVRSESMFSGYRNAPEETERSFCDGWYRTGDLGFMVDDELYVTGRQKDLIIVAGKNLFPEDIEDAVAGVPGVVPGRVVAFAVDDPRAGTEAVAVIVETEVDDEKARATLRLDIVRAGMEVDVTIGQIHLVPSRWLIKSSSGKLARQANRDRLITLELTTASKTD